VAVPRGFAGLGHGRSSGDRLRLRSEIPYDAHSPPAPPRAIAGNRVVLNPTVPSQRRSLQSRLRRWLLWLWQQRAAMASGPVWLAARNLPGPAFPSRVQTCSASALASPACVGNHLLAARRQPGSQPHHLRAASLVQLPARRLAARPGRGWAQRRGCCKRERVLGAGWSFRAVAAGSSPCGPGASSTVFAGLLVLAGSRSTPSRLTTILSRILSGINPCESRGRASGRCGPPLGLIATPEILGEGPSSRRVATASTGWSR